MRGYYAEDPMFRGTVICGSESVSYMPGGDCFQKQYPADRL